MSFDFTPGSTLEPFELPDAKRFIQENAPGPISEAIIECFG